MSPITISTTKYNGVFTPAVNNSYFITPEIERLFARISTLSPSGTQKVMLQGSHGAGKTEMAMQFAALQGMPLLIMDCANPSVPIMMRHFPTLQTLWANRSYS